MSDAKWTPGPWETSQSLGDAYIWAETEENGVFEHVAVVLRCDEPGMQDANAHLIAAAPDLYEALEEIADYVGDEVSFILGPPVVSAARAALAKARGEQ